MCGAGDQFNIQQGNDLTPAVRVFGSQSTPTVNTFANSVTGQNVYPSETPLNGNYTVEAGSCGEATTPAAGQVSAAVASQQTTNVTLPEPGMIILPYAGNRAGRRTMPS